MNERTIVNPPHLQDGKAAFRDLVRSYGGQEAASGLTGKSQPRLSAYGAPNTEDFAPLDVIDALEERTVGIAGHPHVTGWLARRRGFELVKLPDPSAPPMPLTMLLSEMAKAGGQLTAGILAELSPAGEVSPSEAWRRLKDAAELVRVAVELEARLKAKAAEGRGG